MATKTIKPFLFAFCLFLLSFGLGFCIGIREYQTARADYEQAKEESDIEIENLRRQIDELGRAGEDVLGRVGEVGQRLEETFYKLRDVTDSRERANNLGRALVAEVQELIQILRDGEGYFGK